MSTDCAWSGSIYFSYYLILYLFYKDYIELEASSIDLINKNSSTFVINLLVEKRLMNRDTVCNVYNRIEIS
jgi:hypothetical protein